MQTLFIFLGMSVGGWLGWWAASSLGFFWAFMVSSLGSIIGLFAGFKIYRKYF